jgi:hypothetical protein
MRSYSLELSERFGCELSGKQHLRHTAPSKNSELFPEWRRPQQPLLTQLDQLSYIVYTVEVPDEITNIVCTQNAIFLIAAGARMDQAINRRSMCMRSSHKLDSQHE